MNFKKIFLSIFYLILRNIVQVCGGLNDNGPHRPMGSGTIRTYGLVGYVCVCDIVGENVSLGVGFEVSEAQTRM